MMTKKDIKAILINRFGVDSAVQVLPKGRDEVLYLIEAVPVSNEMSVGAVQRLCEDIATALGGYLYGTEVISKLFCPKALSYKNEIKVSFSNHCF